jgi:phosphoribosylanthranilate isomerase
MAQALPVQVKVCGLTRLEDAEAAVAAGADLVGFVFVPGTPRAVREDEVPWVCSLRGAETVGVFRGASLEAIRATRRRLDLDRVQLHGDEPDEWVRALGSGVIRRIGAPTGTGDRTRVELLTALGAIALVDPGAGDGVACDWDDVRRVLAGLPFGLAGGLRPETVADAVRRAGPMLVDVSSGVESAPGVKSAEAIAGFVAAARTAAGAIAPSA